LSQTKDVRNGVVTLTFFPFRKRRIDLSEPNAYRFRSEAEECRKLADEARNPIDKEAWLRLASDWIALAQAAEQRRGHAKEPHILSRA
jgi:hypothetical protein